MENPKDPRFKIDHHKGRVVIEKKLAADVKTTWQAFTNGKIIEKWWAPKPWIVETIRSDFKEGGEWFYAMKGPEGETHYSLVKHQIINPEKSWEFKDFFSDERGHVSKDLPQCEWKVKFIGNENKDTRVHIELQSKTPEQMKELLEMGFKEGFTMALANLDEWIEANR